MAMKLRTALLVTAVVLQVVAALPVTKVIPDAEFWTPETLSRLAWATKIAHARMRDWNWNPDRHIRRWTKWFANKGFDYPAYMDYLKDEDISKYVDGWYPGTPPSELPILQDPKRPLQPFLDAQA